MSVYFADPKDGAAWVTGASSGIGEALALRLAELGFTVAATARSEEKLDALAARASGLAGRIVPMPGDVTNADTMAEMTATLARDHGGIALAVFNAGVYLPVEASALRLDDFRESFAVNLNGVVNGLVPAIDRMKEAGRGQIVIVSSVTGYGGLPTGAAYGATKAALTNLAESLKFDLDKMNIRMQIVHPGFVDTPATAGNEFPMPALMKVEDAVQRVITGIKDDRFEITFPKRFTYRLKFLRLLPYSLYFRAVNGFTGWKKRPLKAQEKVDGQPASRQDEKPDDQVVGKPDGRAFRRTDERVAGTPDDKAVSKADDRVAGQSPENEVEDRAAGKTEDEPEIRPADKPAKPENRPAGKVEGKAGRVSAGDADTAAPSANVKDAPSERP